MTTELPTLEDAEHLVDNGYAEPLDEFVARWQPKHHIDTRIWRKDLQKVLDGYDKFSDGGRKTSELEQDANLRSLHRLVSHD